MAERIKAGVIGLGIMGRQHAEALHDHPEVDLVAVADLRGQVAEEVGAQLGSMPFSDYEEMLKSHSFDLLVTATPDPLHRDPVIAAIQAGVPNLVVEKPFATNMADADAMYEAAEQKGARLFVMFANRSRPLDIATRYVVQQGLVGRVVYGEVRLDDNIAVPTMMWGTRTKEWAGSSTVAHFLLSHVVDLLRWYFHPAEVKEVHAISNREVLGYTPDVFDAFLTFDSGLKMRVKSEWIKHIESLVEFYICLSGSEGTIVYNKIPGFGVEPGWRANLSAGVGTEELMAHQRSLIERGIDVSALVKQRPLLMGGVVFGGGDMKPALESHEMDFRKGAPFVHQFVQAVLEDSDEPSTWKGNGPLPSQLDGLRQAQIVTAIIESSETGRTIILD